MNKRQRKKWDPNSVVIDDALYALIEARAALRFRLGLRRRLAPRAEGLRRHEERMDYMRARTRR